MFSRCLHILLIVGCIANQLALIPHAHAGEQTGKAARPHVHTDWLTRLGAKKSHSHGHSHASHDHRPHASYSHSYDHHHSSDHGQSSEPTDQAPPLDSHGEHDSDCVYVAPLIATGLGAWEVLLSATGVSGCLDVPIAVGPTLEPDCVNQTHTPLMLSASGRDLCLALRNLRI